LPSSGSLTAFGVLPLFAGQQALHDLEELPKSLVVDYCGVLTKVDSPVDMPSLLKLAGDGYDQLSAQLGVGFVRTCFQSKVTALVQSDRKIK
jgi:hypothetical protein